MRQLKNVQKQIQANRWSLESTAKSFEKALTFHLGILHESSNGRQALASHARSPSKAADAAAEAIRAQLLLDSQDDSPRRDSIPEDSVPDHNENEDTGDGGEQHHAGDFDDGYNAGKGGYRYRPRSSRGARQNSLGSEAGAWTDPSMHASVMRSATFLQRLEEVTKERFVKYMPGFFGMIQFFVVVCVPPTRRPTSGQVKSGQVNKVTRIMCLHMYVVAPGWKWWSKESS